MAYITPPSRVTGAVITAAIWNQDIVANEQASAPDVFTTKGDLFVGTAADTGARLAAGNNNALLSANSACTLGVGWTLDPILSSLTLSSATTMILNVSGSTAGNLYANQFSASVMQLVHDVGAGTLDINNTVSSGMLRLYASNDIVFRNSTFDPVVTFKQTGKVLVNETSNANMTIGLTINQDAYTGEVLAFKENFVAHGMTSLAETDTYGDFYSVDGSGGVTLRGLSGNYGAVQIIGYATNGDTTKATTAIADVVIHGYKKSGTSGGALGSNENILAVTSGGTVRFILDADGDSHEDVGTAWTNFDDHDDAALLTALSVQVSRDDDPIRRNFAEFLNFNREILERAKLVTFNENGHHFVNMSKLAMLNTGAIRQLAARVARMEQALLTEGKLNG